MERFDEMLKHMAEQEECIVPKGFDEKIGGALDALPSKAKRGLGAVKGALIAAAVCAALMCTAFAASPGLRELLAEALGGFAPYAQDQEDKTYIVDGFELKVLSALSDGSTIRAYVQARDLEGDRLGPEMEPFGDVNVLTEADRNGETAFRSFTSDHGYAVYDEESKTALLVFTSWAQGVGDLKNAKLEIRHVYDYVSKIQFEPIPEDEIPEGTEVHGDTFLVRPVTDFTLNDVQVTIPLEVESMPKLTFGSETELVKGIGADQAELSPLGLTVWMTQGAETISLYTNDVRVRMADGTEIVWEKPGDWMPSGQGSYLDQETGKYGWILIWNFAEALDLNQVEGVYVGGEYHPIK